ncbi:hypothetical protein [Campylobacter sp. RM16188]|uniref:hypothetical protein n=1 Tax=Campylobacter sp. RM16188 TaxID=1705725 RepID=UPI0015568B2F|nr:hypothetical protein [Campylobacter sp. RM16188]
MLETALTLALIFILGSLAIGAFKLLTELSMLILGLKRFNTLKKRINAILEKIANKFF